MKQAAPPVLYLCLAPLVSGLLAAVVPAAVSPAQKAPDPVERSAGAPPAGSPLLTDATAGSGIDYRNLCGAPVGKKVWLPELIGAGAAWLDYDGDGCLDLYLVNGSAFDRRPGQGEPNRLYRGDGRGHFTDVTASAGVGDRGWGYGVATGDIDNDGDTDIFVTNLGADVLYRNNGNGTFTDITAKAGVGNVSWGASAAFFDYDGDGWLDLYVADYVDFNPARVPKRGARETIGNPACTESGIPVACGPRGLPPAQDVLYRNNGDSTFTDVTKAAGVWLEKPRYALGVVTGDYDNDGDQDVYVANDSVQNSLWRNRGDGFKDVGVQSLTALNAEGTPQAGMGTDFGDYDGDGWLDLVVTNFSQDLNTIYRNEGQGIFSDVSFEVGMSPTFMNLSWGTGFYDFDNDGDLDLFIANGHIYPEVDSNDLGTHFRQPNDLFINEAGRFRKAPLRGGLSVLRSFRGAAFGDYDNDGDVDVLVTALDEPVLLLRNDTSPRGHYLDLRLVGAAGPRGSPAVAPAPRATNRDGVGARVTVIAGGRTQIGERKGGGSFLSASDPKLHFGLGGATVVDTLKVSWPSGRLQVLHDVPVDGTVLLKEEDAAVPTPRPAGAREKPPAAPAGRRDATRGSGWKRP